MCIHICHRSIRCSCMSMRQMFRNVFGRTPRHGTLRAKILRAHIVWFGGCHRNVMNIMRCKCNFHNRQKKMVRCCSSRLPFVCLSSNCRMLSSEKHSTHLACGRCTQFSYFVRRDTTHTLHCKILNADIFFLSTNFVCMPCVKRSRRTQTKHACTRQSDFYCIKSALASLLLHSRRWCDRRRLW